MTEADETIVVSVGDVFQERSAPHRRWRVIDQGLAFQLVCIEDPTRFRFLSAASLADPFRYRRIAAASYVRLDALPMIREVR
jgi:hypothetical protein